MEETIAFTRPLRLSLLSLFLILSYFSLPVSGVSSGSDVKLPTQCLSTLPCDDCMKAGCGYCFGRQICLPGNFGGPADNSTCTGDWIFGFGSCSDLCSKRKTCRTCGRGNFYCKWCEKGGCVFDDKNSNCVRASSCACEDFTSCMGCSMDHADNNTKCLWCDATQKCTSASNPKCPTLSPLMNQSQPVVACGDKCEAQSDCFDCLSYKDCGWCEATDKCGRLTGASNATCPGGSFSRICPSTVHGFDSGSYLGGLFLGLGLSLILVGGFFIWKSYSAPDDMMQSP